MNARTVNLFCPLELGILMSSFQKIPNSFSDYPSLKILKVQKFEAFGKYIKIKKSQYHFGNIHISNEKIVT